MPELRGFKFSMQAVNRVNGVTKFKLLWNNHLIEEVDQVPRGLYKIMN